MTQQHQQPAEEFRLTTNAEDFIAILNAIVAVTHEASLHFNDNGMQTQVYGGADAAMVNLQTDPEQFETLEIDNVILPINLRALLDHIRSVSNEPGLDDPTLNLSLTDNYKLKITTLEGNLTITMGFLDESEINADDETTVPEFKYNTKLNIDPSYLLYLVTQMGKVSESIQMQVNEGTEAISISAEGDIDTMDSTYSKDKALIHSLDHIGTLDALYSTDYLKHLLSTFDQNDEESIELSMGTEHGDIPPLQLHSHLEAASLHTDLTYFLAPRVQSEN